MKKLLYITPYSIPTEKALGVQIVNMCAAFAHAGVEVELVLPQTNQEQDLFRFYNVPRIFTVTRLSRWSVASNTALGYWLRTISFFINARRYASTHKDAIVYGREPMMGLFFKGHVLELHAFPSRVTFAHRFLWARASTIIALTSFVKDSLVKAGVSKGKIFVAGDAVPTSFLESRISKGEARAALDLSVDRQVVAYVGKYKTPFAKGKGVDELIAAFPRIQKSLQWSDHCKPFLLLVGMNADAVDVVKKKCQEAGIKEGDVHIESHALHEQVIKYMRAADVLVMNYPWSEHHAYQMSSMKLFEYMAARRPIVATDLPSAREVVDDSSACLIKPDDEDALVSGVVKVLTDTEHAKHLADTAYEKVQEYIWEKRAEKVINFVNQN